MTNFSSVHAKVVVVAIFWFLAVENQPTVVSGCTNSADRMERDVTGGSQSEAGASCQCGGEPVSRYVNRTDVIKEDILRKLRMLKPPNATAQLRHLPDIPLLHNLLETANKDNNNRERPHNECDDDDDDHVMAMTILALSQPGIDFHHSITMPVIYTTELHVSHKHDNIYF